MPLNLKVYLGNMVIGFLISLIWFYREKKKVGLPLGAMGVMGIWVIPHAFSFYDYRVNSFWEAFVKALDVHSYAYTGYYNVSGHRLMSGEGNTASLFIGIMIIAYTLFFRWLWLLKNRKEANREW